MFSAIKNSVLFVLAIVASTTINLCPAQCNCGVSSGTILADSWTAFPGEYGQPIDGSAIYLTLNVPEAAIVQINGDPTISIGTTRYYVVRELEVGRSYKFKIVVETANAAGVAMEETKTVTLTPGSTEFVTMKPKKRKVVAPAVPTSTEAAQSKTLTPPPRQAATAIQLSV